MSSTSTTSPHSPTALSSSPLLQHLHNIISQIPYYISLRYHVNGYIPDMGRRVVRRFLGCSSSSSLDDASQSQQCSQMADDLIILCCLLPLMLLLVSLIIYCCRIMLKSLLLGHQQHHQKSSSSCRHNKGTRNTSLQIQDSSSSHDVMDSDPTSLDDMPTPSMKNALEKGTSLRNSMGTTQFQRDASSGPMTTTTTRDSRLNGDGSIHHTASGRLTSPVLSSPHLHIQCHKSSLLSLSITPSYIIFIYDDSNDIFLYDIKAKQKLPIALERGGFASCVTATMFGGASTQNPGDNSAPLTTGTGTGNSPTATNTGTHLFLCTDSITEGYCVHKYQLLTQQEKKKRKAESKNLSSYSLDPNRELLVELSDFTSYKHPALICQIKCVRNKYLITRCEDHDFCFIMDAQSGILLSKLCTGQLKTAMFACSNKYLVNASFMTLIKIYAFSDVVQQKRKHIESSQHAKNGGTDSTIVHKFMDLSGHKSSVQYVCFSPDSNQLVSVSNDGTMRLWSLLPAAKGSHCINRCELMHLMEGILPTKCSMLLAWSPSGKHIAFSFENQVVLVDASTLKESSRIVCKTHITVLRWSENSKFVITGHLNGEANFWKVKLGEDGKHVNK